MCPKDNESSGDLINHVQELFLDICDAMRRILDNICTGTTDASLGEEEMSVDKSDKMKPRNLLTQSTEETGVPNSTEELMKCMEGAL